MKKILFLSIFFTTIYGTKAQNPSSNDPTTYSTSRPTYVLEPIRIPVEMTAPSPIYKIAIPSNGQHENDKMICAVAPNAYNPTILIAFSIDIANAKEINSLKIPSGYRLKIYGVNFGGMTYFVSYAVVPAGK